MENPKVLVVGINPWIDNTGINTLINFFDGWDKKSIAHIYTKPNMPNTHMCDLFFRISEAKVLRSIFNFRIKTGEKVTNTPSADEISSDSKIYNKKHSVLVSLAREFVWFFGRWKSKELDAFLDEYDADVLFFPIYSCVYMNRLQNHIRRKTKKPFVLYVSDDNYSYKSIEKNPISFFLRFWLRHHEKKVFKNASKIMVISPKQKEEYDRVFKTDSVVLTKGIDFSNISFEPKPLNSPIKMVYTGKLIIGRWLSLSKIAEVLGEINEKENKIELDIYTTDILTDEQQKLLNRNGCQVKGSLTLSEVQKVQKEADVLVFVESLEKKYKYTARLSFSTKITDYLKNGKCIFAIGDEDIAPIDYFKRYDSAVTATTYDEIEEKLNMLVSSPQIITDYAQRGFLCGKQNHDKKVMDKLLIDTITEVYYGVKK